MKIHDPAPRAGPTPQPPTPSSPPEGKVQETRRPPVRVTDARATSITRHTLMPPPPDPPPARQGDARATSITRAMRLRCHAIAMQRGVCTGAAATGDDEAGTAGDGAATSTGGDEAATAGDGAATIRPRRHQGPVHVATTR